MSYVFDTLASVWQKRIEPHLKDKELARLFAEVIEEMHDANHKLPDAKGIRKGNGMNHARRVRMATHELAEHDRALDAGARQ